MSFTRSHFGSGTSTNPSSHDDIVACDNSPASCICRRDLPAASQAFICRETVVASTLAGAAPPLEATVSAAVSKSCTIVGRFLVFLGTTPRNQLDRRAGDISMPVWPVIRLANSFWDVPANSTRRAISRQNSGKFWSRSRFDLTAAAGFSVSPLGRGNFIFSPF